MARVRRLMTHRRSLIRANLGIALILAVGSCAPTPKPPLALPTPPPPQGIEQRPITPPTLVPQTANWDDLPVIEGNWSYDSGRRSARFVDDSGLERASLSCSVPGRTLRFVLQGETSATAELLTSAGRNAWTVTSGAIDLGINDVALDRMAFSRGRFGLRASTLMVLPVQAEIGRVIEDCRD